ncbi:MAG: hypothetical protein J5496_05850 [Lachnospiraceae bacterium]|nr:hypothetical protein [Lachnospiraceae bacterium]
MKKSKLVIWMITGVLFLSAAVFLAVFLRRQLWPTGGMLFAADFKNGFDLYVEEAYSVSVSETDRPAIQNEPHSLWQVSDPQIKETVYELCRQIRKYRQFDREKDIFYGAADRTLYPGIYFITEDYCYRIEIINWENYSGEEWAGLPIRKEMFGEPLLMVFRIDLSQMSGSDSLYSFVKNYFASDSLNSKQGIGWYSTLSRKSLKRLLGLIQKVGADNAENVFLFE